jgi:hypothetical protein
MVFEGTLLSMHEPARDPDAHADLGRRWKRIGVLSLVALLLHAAALSGLDWAWPSPQVPAALPAVVQVRVVEAAPVADAIEAIAPAPPPSPPAAAVVAVPAKTLAVRAAPVARSTPPTPTAPATAAAEPAAAVALNAPSTDPVAEAVAGDEPIPHYRTRLPPATTLRFEMQRGVLRGVGDLAWRPQGDRYELRFEASVGGLPVLTQVSAGGFDAEGVAPERFTDQRLRRGTSAANFQRAPGKITFSGPSTEFALRAGAQDRLSWMVQLGAIVAAEPQLGVAGAKVAMYVVGSHGDAGVWVFRCAGLEDVPTGAGSVAAIKFVREPREAYDTTVQVWLDPHRHDLPVRAVQKSGPNDEGFDLRLREVVFAN